ncbi:MAG: response regulator, partial [Promethearchaeota archaeon]
MSKQTPLNDSLIEPRTNNDKYTAKILIIDDEPGIRKSLKEILKRHNYKVETAGNYGEIKDKLFSSDYDALILDIILPEVNGIDILHKINKLEINLPTIMLTGAPSLKSAQESVKYGAYDYLTKPVAKSVLLNQIKNAIYKKRLVDSRNLLLEKLKKRKEELETLVEKRTEELKLSEIHYR